jgi:hypothetical protein
MQAKLRASRKGILIGILWALIFWPVIYLTNAIHQAPSWYFHLLWGAIYGCLLGLNDPLFCQKKDH